mgnify:CR=1 FL=1
MQANRTWEPQSQSPSPSPPDGKIFVGKTFAKVFPTPLSKTSKRNTKSGHRRDAFSELSRSLQPQCFYQSDCDDTPSLFLPDFELRLRVPRRFTGIKCQGLHPLCVRSPTTKAHIAVRHTLRGKLLQKFSPHPFQKLQKGIPNPATGEMRFLNCHAPSNRNVSIESIMMTHHRCFSLILNSGCASRAGLPASNAKHTQPPARNRRFSWHALRGKLLQTVSAQNRFPIIARPFASFQFR